MIKLQMLLRSDCRHEDGVRAVTKELQKLGLNVTAAGRVTVSAESTPDAFVRVFGVKPNAEALSAEALSVPAALSRYVENVSVVPPHIRMDKKGKD